MDVSQCKVLIWIEIQTCLCVFGYLCFSLDLKSHRIFVCDRINCCLSFVLLFCILVIAAVSISNFYYLLDHFHPYFMFESNLVNPVSKALYLCDICDFS